MENVSIGPKKVCQQSQSQDSHFRHKLQSSLGWRELLHGPNGRCCPVSGGQSHTSQDPNVSEASVEHLLSRTQVPCISLKGAAAIEPQIKLAWDRLEWPSWPQSPHFPLPSGASSDCPTPPGALGQGRRVVLQQAPLPLCSLWMLTLVPPPCFQCFREQPRAVIGKLCWTQKHPHEPAKVGH